MEKPKKYKKPKIYKSEVVFPFGVVEIIAIKKKWSRSVIVRTEVVEDNRIIGRDSQADGNAAWWIMDMDGLKNLVRRMEDG